MAGSIRLNSDDLAFIKDVNDGAVTWRMDMGGRITYRLWSSETDCIIVTRRAKRLEAAGLICRWHGVTYGRGGVENTSKGKALI